MDIFYNLFLTKNLHKKMKEDPHNQLAFFHLHIPFYFFSSFHFDNYFPFRTSLFQVQQGFIYFFKWKDFVHNRFDRA